MCLGLCERIEYKLLFLSLIKFLLLLSLPLHVAIRNVRVRVRVRISCVSWFV